MQKHWLAALLLLAFSVTISACSGSGAGDPDSNVEDLDNESATISVGSNEIVSDTVDTNSTADNGTADNSIDQNLIITPPDFSTDEGGEVTSESELVPVETVETPAVSIPDSSVENPAIPDPLTQSTLSVDFRITVPAYMSDSLQLGIVWGETEFNAQWVGDEFWAATTEYPTDTENLLSVTFYDNNGSLVLATFEELYRTGANASETFEITVDQFNTEIWDTDGDGISNLSESVAGMDPLLDESLVLEVQDSFSVHSSVFISESFNRDGYLRQYYFPVFYLLQV